MTTRAEDVHDGTGGGQRANPAHIFAEEVARGFAEFFDFETFHAESFHDAIAADGFLKDLAEVGEASAAGFGGAADAAGQLCDGPDDEGHENSRADGHAPVNYEQHGDEDDQAENLAEEIREIIGEGAAHLLDIGDYRGHDAADGIVMEEADGLLHDFGVHAIAEIGDAGEADILNQGAAEIFREGLHQENKKQREREHGPDVVNARGNEIVHVHDAIGAGNLEEDEFLQRGVRIQNHVESGLDGERDQAFGDAHDGHEQNARRERERVGSEKTRGAAAVLRFG